MDPITAPPLSAAGKHDAKPSVTEILQRLAEAQERLAAAIADVRPQAHPEAHRD
jgi:hypothetical protein